MEENAIVSPANIERLRKYYQVNPTARSLFDYFASRKRGRESITVDSVVKKLNSLGQRDVTRHTVTTFLKELAACDCGEFKIGRRGRESRLEWKVSMVTVGQIAAGLSDGVSQAPFSASLTAPEPGVSDEDLEPDRNGAVVLKHSFHLRPGITVTFRLPADFTMAEAFRLADYICTLPMGEFRDRGERVRPEEARLSSSEPGESQEPSPNPRVSGDPRPPYDG